MKDRLVKQFGDVWFVQVIVDMLAVAFAHDEAEVAQLPELMGNGRKDELTIIGSMAILHSER